MAVSVLPWPDSVPVIASDVQLFGPIRCSKRVRMILYARNAEVLTTGMVGLGFQPLLSTNQSGPIIQTFLTPRDSNFKFETFYEKLRQRGFAIYPGKLTQRDSFRIGTIGHLNEAHMLRVVTAIKDVLQDMNVKDLMPRDL